MVLVLVALAASACDPPLGSEGGACYASGVCDEGLECAGGVCVVARGPDAGDAVDAAAAPDATPPGSPDAPPVPEGLLYVVDNALPARLTAIDPATLEQTVVGSLGTLVLYGDCAFHGGEHALYVADGLEQIDIAGDNELYRVDLSTGAATLVGSHGVPELFALAYHPPTDALYGVSVGDRNLYRIDTETAAATLVATVGLGSINGMAWDSVRERMVVLTASLAGGHLYELDVATGAVTDLGPTPGINNNGLTYDAHSDLNWAVDTNGKLFQLDPAVGYAATLVTELATGYSCIAHVPGAP